MTLDEILAMWEVDSRVDYSEVGRCSADIPILHHKYLKQHSHERLRLRKMQEDLKVLRHQKHLFYLDGPDEETEARGWRLPPKGRILKGEVQQYVDTDQDVVKATLALAYQNEKVDVLGSIMGSINFRSNALKNAVEWEKFKVGA
jgi:hypothetical protein